jgi:hypothetical protein
MNFRQLKTSTCLTALFICGLRLSAFAQTLPISPDLKLTPGDVLTTNTNLICTPGYSKSVRAVPTSVKKQVFQMYGITKHKAGEFEVDHLISLELGGSNSIRNLWPQSYVTKLFNAHVKDKLENRLHKLVCSGQLDIKQAQSEIANNWIAAYRKYIGGAP